MDQLQSVASDVISGLRSDALSKRSKALASLRLLLHCGVGIGDHSTTDYHKNIDEALEQLISADDRLNILDKYVVDGQICLPPIGTPGSTRSPAQEGHMIKVELVKTDLQVAAADRLQQRSGDGAIDRSAYRVCKLTNAVEPAIGSLLSTKEAKYYIGLPGWTVIIREVD